MQVDDRPSQVGSEDVRVPQVTETASHAHEGVLNKVLGVLAIAAEIEGEPECVRCVCDVELLQPPGCGRIGRTCAHSHRHVQDA